MARQHANKQPRDSIWSGTPYGTYQGPRGNSDRWRVAFGEAMGESEAKEVLGDDSPWAILGIPAGSASAIIKTAWRRYALKWHPDKCKEIDAEGRFKKGLSAYTVLTAAGR